MKKWERKWLDPDYDFINEEYYPEQPRENKNVYQYVRECLGEGMTAAETVEWLSEETACEIPDIIAAIEEIQEEL